MAAAETPSKPVTWLDHLMIAATADDVIWVVRDYVASLTPMEITVLPVPCRPPAKFSSPAEIVDFAFRLARTDRVANSGNETLTRVATFFSNASNRVAELMGKADPSED